MFSVANGPSHLVCKNCPINEKVWHNNEITKCLFHFYQIMKNSSLSGDGEVEMDEVDVVGARLEDVRLFRDRFSISMVKPVEKQLRVLDDDKRLDDHHLEELLYETLFDLNSKKSIFIINLCSDLPR
jgi:hypothetical protein